MQRTPEWHAMRCGKFTASNVAKLMSGTDSKPASGYWDVVTEVALERVTGEQREGYMSGPMLRGIELEDEACEWYALTRDVDLVSVDFVDHPTVPMSGCSPDRLVGDDGLLEMKCPMHKAHWDYLLNSKLLASAYRYQCQWQMACTGRQWCELASYHPDFMGERFKPGSEMVVVRIQRDEEVIESIIKRIERAERDVMTRVERVAA